MLEVYPGRGTHNRTREYEEEVDCAFRIAELPWEVSIALAGYALDIGSTPLDVSDQLATEWLEFHREEVETVTEVDIGWPYDEWRLPAGTDTGTTPPETSPETIHQYFTLRIDNLTGILKYAQLKQIPPAAVAAQVITEGLDKRALADPSQS